MSLSVSPQIESEDRRQHEPAGRTNTHCFNLNRVWGYASVVNKFFYAGENRPASQAGLQPISIETSKQWSDSSLISEGYQCKLYT